MIEIFAFLFGITRITNDMACAKRPPPNPLERRVRMLLRSDVG